MKLLTALFCVWETLLPALMATPHPDAEINAQRCCRGALYRHPHCDPMDHIAGDHKDRPYDCDAMH